MAITLTIISELYFAGFCCNQEAPYSLVALVVFCGHPATAATVNFCVCGETCVVILPCTQQALN